jgi:hypothetical protein
MNECISLPMAKKQEYCNSKLYSNIFMFYRSHRTAERFVCDRGTSNLVPNTSTCYYCHLQSQETNEAESASKTNADDLSWHSASSRGSGRGGGGGGCGFEAGSGGRKVGSGSSGLCGGRVGELASGSEVAHRSGRNGIRSLGKEVGLNFRVELGEPGWCSGGELRADDCASRSWVC